MLNVLYLQIAIVLLIIVGIVLKKIKIISEQGKKELTNLVIYLILPCNILKAFIVDFQAGMGADFVKIVIISIAIQLFSLIYGRVGFRRLPKDKRKCVAYGIICSNAGFLGNPIAEGLYGEYGLLLASLFLIPLRIMMWTEGVASFSGETDLKSTIKKVITHPCILACIVGLLLMLTGLDLPTPITNTIGFIGQCNTAFSMIVIGMILADIDLKSFGDLDVLKYCLHRLVIIPLIVFIVLKHIGISGTVLGLSVILVAMPAGATTSILAEKYNVESVFATKLVVVSTALSVIAIPIWNYVLTILG